MVCFDLLVIGVRYVQCMYAHNDCIHKMVAVGKKADDLYFMKLWSVLNRQVLLGFCYLYVKVIPIHLLGIGCIGQLHIKSIYPLWKINRKHCTGEYHDFWMDWHIE